ncbi:BREX-1 system phosphatase PglZ type B [Mycolicibacterium austroafricanum]|uniref:BREX-1 system phosphatase PglZ type B n=1 Tax=Mycolicibacterium austroafricanum TaxID=39687 RepID=UPI001CA31169|nr:BREX-1 system phosphatase PglZ type B [Mycolicibacterium austroafricanum]QZT60282.1 BREX-1 system phosphatase PglZ type B [Mycolicibacterium austroafricanum]
MTATTTTARVLTVRDALFRAIRDAAEYNPTDVEAPVAVLWPDADGAWGSLVEKSARDLRVLRLGDYRPETNTGPTIFLRIEIARQARTSGADGGLPPVVYLPGVSRKQLADTESLPEELRPLGGLLVRSCVFAQRNGSDWTPFAFFTNAGVGLNLKVSGDGETRKALRRCLPRLLDIDVSSLSGRVLSSVDFDELVVDDPVRDILLWLDNPDLFQSEAQSEGKWAGFVSLVSAKYGTDPEKDGPLAAGARMGDRTGPWAAVWARFVESPRSYPAIPEVLRRSKPEDVMPLHTDSWPQDNKDAEAAAFAGVSALAGKPNADMRQRLSALSKEHAPRLTTVWAKLGLTPAAGVVEQLTALASATSSTATGATVEDLAEHYASTGWRADDAFMNALRSLEPGHSSAKAVTQVAESLYRPWLEATTATFQNAWQSVAPAPTSRPMKIALADSGTCIVFVDGLRYDTAMALSQNLDQRGMNTRIDWAFAAVPTVTGTCKPSVSPASDEFTTGSELAPKRASGAAYSQEQLKRALADRGWTFIPGDTDGDPTGRGWIEGGDIDNLGHTLGAKLAHHLPSQISALTARVSELLVAGWQQILVVTDHGWLLLPSKLPKHVLPEHLTVVRKGRCARLREEVTAPAGVSVLPWRWDSDVQIAVAPGIHAFEEGKVYEHGGISPQESVVPVLSVTAESPSAPARLNIDVSWVGLTLQVECGSAPEGAVVDIRTRAADAESSLVTRPKPLKNGKARLLASDENEGAAAFVVVLDEGNHPLAQQLTQIPEG